MALLSNPQILCRPSGQDTDYRGYGTDTPRYLRTINEIAEKISAYNQKKAITSVIALNIFIL